jgi:hypothetical protein
MSIPYIHVTTCTRYLWRVRRISPIKCLLGIDKGPVELASLNLRGFDSYDYTIHFQQILKPCASLHSLVILLSQRTRLGLNTKP